MADTKKDKKENEGSVAARAWNKTKEENDPEWDLIPNAELKGKLEFAVDRVKATGIAQTNFEIAAKEILAADQEANKDEGPMAVSAPVTALGGAAPLSLPEEDTAKAIATGAAKAKTTAKSKSTAKSKTAAKSKGKSASAKAAAKTDQSGHVPTAEEKAAAAKAEEEAPLR